MKHHGGSNQAEMKQGEINQGEKTATLNQNRTVACRATGLAPAAVCVIVVRGCEAAKAIGKYWAPAAGRMDGTLDQIRFGPWSSSGSEAEEGVVVCQTSAEGFEIHCHGGVHAARRILDDLRREGVEEVESLNTVNTPTEWDLIQQSAFADLAQATTPLAAKVLLDQWRGAFSQQLNQIIQAIHHQHHSVAFEQIDRLLERASFGIHLLSPWKIVLCGPPNVGKSSLLNRILGYERVIVHATPGTTRDVIEERASVRGIPVVFLDTAGFRESEDAIELSGMEAASQAIDSCDLMLLLVSADQGWTSKHAWLRDLVPERCMVVGTKSDLRATSQGKTPIVDVWTSVSRQEGLDDLFRAIEERLDTAQWKPGSPVPFRNQQRLDLRKARERLESNDFEQAIATLRAMM